MKESLIKLIEGLIVTLGNFKTSISTYFDGREKDNNLILEKIAILDGREKNLKEREAAVKDIEDPIALKREAGQLMEAAKVEMAKAEDRAKAVEALALENGKRNNAELDKIKAGNERLTKEWEAYNAAQSAFIEEKKNFKAKIAAGLVELADGQ